MTKYSALVFWCLFSAEVGAAPVETFRFEIELNQQMCTGHDGADVVCTGDGTRAPIEVALDRVAPSEIETQAFEGQSEALGLALSASLRHRPVITVRKSRVGTVTMYTLRFRSTRESDEARTYETVYIEEGETLEMAKPLVLMADRFGNGVRFSRQVFLNLRKLP